MFAAKLQSTGSAVSHCGTHEPRSGNHDTSHPAGCRWLPSNPLPTIAPYGTHSCRAHGPPHESGAYDKYAISASSHSISRSVIATLVTNVTIAIRTIIVTIIVTIATAYVCWTHFSIIAFIANTVIIPILVTNVTDTTNTTNTALTLTSHATALADSPVCRLHWRWRGQPEARR